jgi:hypothetical protein
VQSLLDFLNENYSDSEFNDVRLEVVQKLASTCATGCDVTDTKAPLVAPSYEGFTSILARCASNVAGS